MSRQTESQNCAAAAHGGPSGSTLRKGTEPVEKCKDNPCEHPWGEPMGYPYEGFWRCSACGDIYKR